MPKLLIVMKHGAFDDRGWYKPGAEQNIRAIATYLRGIIGDRSAKILTSGDDSCVKTTQTINETLALPTFESEMLNLANAPHDNAVARLLGDHTINRFDVFLLIVAESVMKDALRVAVAAPFSFTAPRVPVLEIPCGAFALIDGMNRTVLFFTH